MPESLPHLAHNRNPSAGVFVGRQREMEVLRLIATGSSNPIIAEKLVISVNTVERHVSNILSKCRSANRAEAVAYAARNGLIS